MAIIGRKQEQNDFLSWLSSDTAELICIYGRRRIGKTYFINELLADFYAFDASALENANEQEQIRAFFEALKDYGCQQKTPPKNWWDAFRILRALLEDKNCPRSPEGMRVLFFDEFPWYATPRSSFMNAFSDFWNRWAQRKPDVKVIICGSATSWILKEVIQTEGSMNRRVTHTLYLEPFTLAETESFLKTERNIQWGRREIIECYMVFGGTPFYLQKLQARLSLSENITALCLGPHAVLKDEAKRLLDSTLSNKPLYYKILGALGTHKNGLSRKELVDSLEVKDGSGFTTALIGLEECGFIRRYRNPYRKGKKDMYQLIDPFLLFSLKFIVGEKYLQEWSAYYDTPSYNAWRGNAFEIVGISHLTQIRNALSLLSMDINAFSWNTSQTSPGAQIDLVIERPDKITYLLEMKFTNTPFRIDSKELAELRRKTDVFKSETKTRNAVQIVVLSAAGFANESRPEPIAYLLAGDDLFRA